MEKISYNIEKAKKLYKERSIDLQFIAAFITEGLVIDIIKHPNQKRYPGQKIYVINIYGYIWLVPYVENGDEIFIKTAFPSRKHTKQYCKEQKNENI